MNRVKNVSDEGACISLRKNCDILGSMVCVVK